MHRGSSTVERGDRSRWRNRWTLLVPSHVARCSKTYLPNVFVKFRGIPTRICHFVSNERSDTQQNCRCIPYGCEHVDELMLSIHRVRARFISIGSCIGRVYIFTDVSSTTKTVGKKSPARRISRDSINA